MTRMNTLETLAAVGYYVDEDVCDDVFQALFQGNRKLRGKSQTVFAGMFREKGVAKKLYSHT